LQGNLKATAKFPLRMNLSLPHTTVLLEAAVEALLSGSGTGADGTVNGCFVDGTFGRGGHTRRILQRLSPQGRLLAFDRDPQAVAAAKHIQDARFTIYHQGFSQLNALPAASVQGVLLDLGISSPQIDDPQRGFSLRFDGPLDMRMDTTRGQSVAEWLATADEAHIGQVIRDYGEERCANQIAKAIVVRRKERGAISGTAELAALVAAVVRSRHHNSDKAQHPATRTFQALRIFINAELRELELALQASLRVLAPGGRLVVISFHSLEDRIVKQFIVRHSRVLYDRSVPFVPGMAGEERLLFKNVARMRPSAVEIAANPRARSAMMRVAERTQVPAC